MRPSILQVLAPATLSRVEDIFPEEAMTIGGYITLADSVLVATGNLFIEGRSYVVRGDMKLACSFVVKVCRAILSL